VASQLPGGGRVKSLVTATRITAASGQEATAEGNKQQPGQHSKPPSMKFKVGTTVHHAWQASHVYCVQTQSGLVRVSLHISPVWCSMQSKRFPTIHTVQSCVPLTSPGMPGTRCCAWLSSCRSWACWSAGFRLKPPCKCSSHATHRPLVTNTVSTHSTHCRI
jgi:hypothetical protein